MTPPDDDTRNLVRRAGDAVPVTPAPVQALLQQGRGARRRRTVTVIGVVAASVAVITGGAVAVGSQLTRDANTQAASPTISDGTVIPAPGTRLVGRNGIAVAISENMFYADARTSDSAKIRWRLPTDPSKRKDFPPEVGPAVTIESIPPSAVRFYGPHAHSIGRINGAIVHRYGPYESSAWSDFVSAFPYYQGALWSRDADVFIWVTARSRTEVAAILNSVVPIPSSSVAIPSHPTTRDLSRLGLEVRQVYPYCVHPGPVVSSTRPAPGSVVQRGATVTAIFC